MGEGSPQSAVGNVPQKGWRSLGALVWACLIFGTLIFVGNLAVIWLDAWLAERGYTTVSRFTLNLGRAAPWTAFVAGLVGLLPYTTLAGHLYFPTDGDDVVFWAMTGMLLAVLIGPLVGHHLFPQSGR